MKLYKYIDKNTYYKETFYVHGKIYESDAHYKYIKGKIVYLRNSVWEIGKYSDIWNAYAFEETDINTLNNNIKLEILKNL